MTASGWLFGRIRGRFVAWSVGALLVVLVAAPTSAATGWTEPLPVGSWEGCADVVAAIDGTGGYHVVAGCGPDIRYASRVRGGWSTTTFSRPRTDFIADTDPQVAIDGSRIYVAYSREDWSATCGVDILGVWYRWRSLTNGKWSAASQLGDYGDSLQSFRVVGGVIHATVGNEANVVYERQASGVLERYPLWSAAGGSSLRISNDGTARIVYQATRSLRYGTFNGSSVKTSAIPGTTANDRNPVLVLDAQDNPHVAWTRTGGPSCGDESPNITGSYYATNQAGSWTAPSNGRITGDLGTISLTVDVATRRVHLLVAGDFGVKYYTKTPRGAWRGQRLSSEFAGGAAIRLDAANGQLLAVFSLSGESGVRYTTKP